MHECKVCCFEESSNKITVYPGGANHAQFTTNTTKRNYRQLKNNANEDSEQSDRISFIRASQVGAQFIVASSRAGLDAPITCPRPANYVPWGKFLTHKPRSPS